MLNVTYANAAKKSIMLDVIMLSVMASFILHNQLRFSLNKYIKIFDAI